MEVNKGIWIARVSLRFLLRYRTTNIRIAKGTIKPITTTTKIVVVSIIDADFGDTVVASIAVAIGGDFVRTVVEVNAAVKHIDPNYAVTVPL